MTKNPKRFNGKQNAWLKIGRGKKDHVDDKGHHYSSATTLLGSKHVFWAPVSYRWVSYRVGWDKPLPDHNYYYNHVANKYSYADETTGLQRACVNTTNWNLEWEKNEFKALSISPDTSWHVFQVHAYCKGLQSWSPKWLEASLAFKQT